MWFARRFGGVRRLSPKCFGAWKVPASGNMRLARRFGRVLAGSRCVRVRLPPQARMWRLRDVSEVFSLRVQMCLGVFCSYTCECLVCATFWRCLATSATCFGAWKIPASGNMRLARRFGGVPAGSRCSRLRFSLQARMWRLRDVSEVFL